MEDSYYIGKYFLNQIIDKVIYILGSLSSGYKLLIIFDNTASHFIYAKDVLQVTYINKKPISQ